LRHRVGEFWAPTTDLIYRRSAGLARKVRTWSGKSGPCPDFFTRAVSLIWAVEFEIGGRYFGRQNVHLWSARFTEKVRKRWTEKTKVRTWSGKSGLFTDLAIYIHTGVPGRRCECSHPEDLIWVAEFEIGGRYFGRQNVHLWSARFTEKVRKRWTEKTKVRTWSGKSGPCPDFFTRAVSLIWAVEFEIG